MSEPKLFMLLVGCKPAQRHTEQHDVYFGISYHLKDLKKDINEFWPEALGKIHVDAWREVTSVGGSKITIVPKSIGILNQEEKLFFINLGGYQKGRFEEQHFALLTVSRNKTEATKEAKSTVFFRHNQFGHAVTHIDDRYGIDVDDLHQIEEILPDNQKDKYSILIEPGHEMQEDEIHLGYLKL